jgi:AhpD family alkylhydroperoxidase
MDTMDTTDHHSQENTLKRKDATMMLDWNEYRKQLGAAIAEIGRFSPETVRGYRELSDAGNKTGRRDPKTRELIALAVAVTRQCDRCITVHTDAAILHGAAREEIAPQSHRHLRSPCVAPIVPPCGRNEWNARRKRE